MRKGLRNIIKLKKKMNKELHTTILIRILKKIYSDPVCRKNLGFKDGTAMKLFYELPRISVDLDFNLLDSQNENQVFNILRKLLPEFGELVESKIKRFALFFLVRYEKGERNVKIEISRRPVFADFEVKNYLGFSVLVMKKEDMAAGKLSALLTRKKFASRDLFDLWFILKNDWHINEKFLASQISLSLPAAINKAIEKVENVKSRELLQGLGELLDEKQKNWVRDSLKGELLFELNLRKAK